MNAASLLYAMSGIRGAYVQRAGDFLGYAEGKAAPHRLNRRMWTVLIAAALVISLLTATAYAMGWFGLRQRMIESMPETAAAAETVVPEKSPAPTAEPKRWVSLNGYADSPEYRANAEWLRFREEYLASHTITNDNSWMDDLDEETVNTCHYYGVYERAMLDELNALAEQYGLRLHTHQVSPLSLDDFYRAAGTGAFLNEGGGSGYIYEDGSFKLETSGSQDRYLLTILKNLSGAILPLSSGMDRPENYEEWEYTNVHGDTVLMAFNEHREDIDASMADLRIFFDADGVFIMAHAGFYHGEPVTKADCEGIADRIIFHELLKTETDFSVLYVKPTVAESPEDAATLADFLLSPEGAALWEYNKTAWHLGGTDAGIERQKTVRQELCEQYALCDYAAWWEVIAQEKIDTGTYAGDPVMNEEEFAALGYDRKITEQFHLIEVFDNGIIACISRLKWCYIPDGALCADLLDPFPDSFTQEWFYQTRCGAVVQLCLNVGSLDPQPFCVCRTPDGWLIGQGHSKASAHDLEEWVDEIDFTIFP